jgi:hypothetical protein
VKRAVDQLSQELLRPVDQEVLEELPGARVVLPELEGVLDVAEEFQKTPII